MTHGLAGCQMMSRRVFLLNVDGAGVRSHPGRVGRGFPRRWRSCVHVLPRRTNFSADVGENPWTTTTMAPPTTADNVEGDANNDRAAESGRHVAQHA